MKVVVFMTAQNNSQFFHLLIQVGKTHFHQIRKRLQQLNLYRGQPRLLHLLWKKDGRTQKELGNKLHSKPATVAKMVQRMQKSGFVEKRKDEEDKRISRVYLTDKGKDIKSEVDEMEQEIEKKILKGFNTEEKVLLRRFLRQIKDNLQNNN